VDEPVDPALRAGDAAGMDVLPQQVGVRKLKSPEADGDPILGTLWAALLEQVTPNRLRERFKRIRKVARQPTATKTPAAAGAVGRNEPCPCGSGKKYKRCCGA
jgi:hypothetical protein